MLPMAYTIRYHVTELGVHLILSAIQQPASLTASMVGVR